MSDSISKDILQYMGENDFYFTDFEKAALLVYDGREHICSIRSLISKDVMQYMKENDLHFTDFEKATIIYNSRLPVNEKHYRLERLAEETDDEVLAQQIKDRLFDDRHVIETFLFDTEGYIYSLEFFFHRNCFAIPKSAYEYGKSEGQPLFTIGKYKIVSNEEVGNNKNKQFYEINDPRNPSSVIFIRRYYPSSELDYNGDGTLFGFLSNEIDLADKRVQNEKDNTRFENAPINMPNPFERGDIVKLIDMGMLGIIETSQEEWNNKYEALRNGKFSKESIDVATLYNDGTLGQLKMSPLLLEKYEPEKGDEVYELLTYGRDAYKGKIPLEQFTHIYKAFRERKEKMDEVRTSYSETEGISISEFQGIYDEIKNQIIFMLFECASFSFPGFIMWLAEDGREWRLVLEDYKIPDQEVLALFPEIDTCVKDYEKIFEQKHETGFQYINGWVGRGVESEKTIFIREDFFNQYKSKFNNIENIISVYDKIKTIEEILHTEEPIFICPNDDQ